MAQKFFVEMEDGVAKTVGVSPDGSVPSSQNELIEVADPSTVVIGYAYDNGQWVVPTNKSHTELRQKFYPSIGEQLDMLYWDNVNGTTVWKDAITQVKIDYPNQNP